MFLLVLCVCVCGFGLAFLFLLFCLFGVCVFVFGVQALNFHKLCLVIIWACAAFGACIGDFLHLPPIWLGARDGQKGRAASFVGMHLSSAVGIPCLVHWMTKPS